MVIRILVTVAALLTPFTAISTAHADTTDNKFLALLKSEGISDHISPDHAIQAAHEVCQQLDAGKSPSDVASDVLNSSEMPAYHCGYFVGAAIKVYCPQYTPEESGSTA
jgi:Protein of unknown function (DUF732)